MMIPKKSRLVLFEIFMLLCSLIIIIPLMVMVLGSFKSSAEAAQFNLMLPEKWLFGNYVFVYEVANILRATFNSFVVTFFSVVLCIGTASLCGFVLSRKKSRFTSAVGNLFLMGMIAPLQIITTFGLLRILNLTGTYVGVICVFAGFQLPWAIFMITGFVKTIPIEMDEAAAIDGCGPLQLFVKVILPLLKPVVVTTIVMVAMTVWNDFKIPLYFFNSSTRWTLPLTVYNFFGMYFNDWNYVFANLMIVAIPITILYLYAQKYIIDGMTAGATKG